MSWKVASALCLHLLTVSEITEHVDDRIYSSKILPPDVDYPAVNGWRVTKRSHQSLTSAVGLGEALYQFDVWSREFWQADEIAEQIRMALQPLASTQLTDGNGGTVTIRGVMAEEGPADFDYEEDLDLHHHVAEFRVSYEEAVT